MQFGVKEGILVNIEPFIEEYSTELKRVFEYNDVFASPPRRRTVPFTACRASSATTAWHTPGVHPPDWLDKLN